jgi:hypothetical protein
MDTWAERMMAMGLEEDVHLSVKMPEGGGVGYVRILREGLAYAAWLSVYGSGRQRELAADFVRYILQRAWEEGDDIYEKAEEIVEEGKTRGSLTLKGFEKKVVVNGRKHVVKVTGRDAELEESQSGETLLRILITVEVDTPGGREKDAERLAAVVEALMGKKPKIRRMKKGRVVVKCGREHLDCFARYVELADAIEK